MGSSDRLGGRLPKRRFQATEKGVEKIEHDGFAALQNFAKMLIGQRAEHERCLTVPGMRLGDAPAYVSRLGFTIDKWLRDALEVDGFELAQETPSEGFGGDGGVIGYEEDGAFHAFLTMRCFIPIEYRIQGQRSGEKALSR
jgi:hypothetical protein